jgi:hypothetical protein
LAAALSAGAAAQTDPQALEAKRQFEAGMTAMNAGDLPRARELFLASIKLVAKANTVFNLAVCEEKMGLLATAAKHYDAALGLLAPNDDRRPTFNQQIAAIAPRVPALRIDLPAGAPQGTRALLGADELPAAKLGVELPLDPGPYKVTVKAPGRPDKVYSIDLTAGRRETIVAAPGEPVPVETGTGALRIAGFVTAGAGLVGLGVWGATGLLALDKKAALDRMCPDLSRCVIQGAPRAAEGQTLATASTVAFAIGLAGLGAGITMIAVGGKSRSVTAQAAVGPGGAGLAVRGSF